MVELVIERDKVILEMAGWNKRSRTKSRIELSLTHLAGVRADSFLARSWIKRVQFLGNFVPNLIQDGILYEDGDCAFWEVHNPDKAIVLYLEDEPYTKLIVEVADPAGAVALIEKAFSQSEDQQMIDAEAEP